MTARLDFTDPRPPLLERLRAKGLHPDQLDKDGLGDYVREWIAKRENPRRRRRNKYEVARDKKARR